MTPCSYCGRENEDAITHCTGCGSNLRPSELPLGPEIDWKPSPKLRLSARLGVGVILVCSAFYYGALRIFFDLHEMAHGGPLGKPGIYAVGMMFIPCAILLGIGSFVFAVAVFSKRCSEGGHCIVAALLTLGILAMLLLDPGIAFFVPAFLLGKVTHSSIVGYLASIIQVLLGGWLLGWFERRRRCHENVEPDSAGNAASPH